MKWQALLCFLALSVLMPASEIKTRFLQTADGQSLRVLESGQGRPLLFVPGWTMTAEIWQLQMEALSDEFRVISFDPRGQGQSSKPAKGYGTPKRADDIFEIISQCELEKAVLIGWSLGAVDSVGYLQRHKGRGLAAAVLVDNSVDKNFSSGQTGASLVNELDSHPMDEVIGTFVPSIFKSTQDAGRLNQLKALSLQTPVYAAREALTRASTGKGLLTALNSAGLPALYLVTPRFAEEARKLEAASEGRVGIEIFESSGHALFVDDAERFNRSIRRFAGRLP